MGEFARRKGEFPTSTWRAAKDTHTCYWCGTPEDPNDPFEVHHRIFLASEAAKQFPLELLRSIANAGAIHRSCHDSVHNQYDEPPAFEVQEVLEKFRGQKVQLSLFSTNLSYKGTKRRLG